MSSMPSSTRETIHFVTGKLAAPAVRECVARLADERGFDYTIDVLPITVAALMTPAWLLRHLNVPPGTTRVLVPGYLERGIEELRGVLSVPVECGPKDIRDLPAFFGEKKRDRHPDYGHYTVEILAEINEAPRWDRQTLVQQASRLIAEGANVIDLGCIPGYRWGDVGDAIRSLVDLGIRCSIDTFDPIEAQMATAAGAELVLSVNRTNREACVDWGCEVVVIPELGEGESYLSSLEATAAFLDRHRVPYRLDPILEPIGCGFTASLQRYYQVRQRFPETPMMMGIGNITELTDCDSAGINLLLLAICHEWQIHSVLTTQVISWCQTAVRECDVGRRLVAYAARHQIPPKRVESALIMLRDPRLHRDAQTLIEHLAATIKDHHFRILVADDQIHLLSAGVHLTGTDPYAIIDELLRTPSGAKLDASHAFYLGFEMSKALTAITLGKQYEQDESLGWGMLTRPEIHHRLVKKPGGRDKMEGI